MHKNKIQFQIILKKDELECKDKLENILKFLNNFFKITIQSKNCIDIKKNCNFRSNFSSKIDLPILNKTHKNYIEIQYGKFTIKHVLSLTKLQEQLKIINNYKISIDKFLNLKLNPKNILLLNLETLNEYCKVLFDTSIEQFDILQDNGILEHPIRYIKGFLYINSVSFDYLNMITILFFKTFLISLIDTENFLIKGMYHIKLDKIFAMIIGFIKNMDIKYYPIFFDKEYLPLDFSKTSLDNIPYTFTLYNYIIQLFS